MFRWTRERLDARGPCEVRVTRSQVAFRCRRGFAYVWMPGRYLAHPSTEVVLSVALPRHVPSPRFKEVVHPTAQQWLHHLEGWLTESYDAAG